MRRKFTGTTNVAVIALLGVLATVGVGWAAIPGSDGQIKGCYATTNGLLLGIPHSKGDTRIVDSGEACRSYEKTIAWNQQGPRGETGAAGPTGQTGPQGPAGASDAYRKRARNVSVGPFSDNWAKVATLDLPAGHYSLTASLDLANREETPQFANCRLSSDDQWVKYVRLDEALTAELIVLQDLVTLGTPGTVDVECSSPARSEVLTAELAAIRVGAIHL